MKYALLLIDDDHDICEALRDFLTSYGFEVCAVATGAEAINVARGRVFTAIILDVNLRDTSGLEVLRILKRIDRSVPVVVLTAFFTDQNQSEAFREGAFAFLCKPYDRAQVLSTLTKAIGGHA